MIDDLKLKEGIRKKFFELLAPEEERHILIVKRGESYFSIEFSYVKEVISPPPIKILPRSPSFIKGIFSHFGRILPVIEISEFIKVQKEDIKKVLCLLLSDGYYIGGIFINDYPVFKTITEEEVFPVEKERAENEFIKGIIKEKDRAIPIIDLPRIFETIRERIKLKDER